ncbi:Ribosome biogenesis protein [Spironucleus salmonicida]|nr:Ribosome biogenesis protein [Spironucleus salmonicida]
MKQHTINRQQKQQIVKQQQKQQNVLNKQLENAPLLVGIGCYQIEYQTDQLIAHLQQIIKLSSRPIIIVPINLHGKFALDEIFPLNILIIITSDIIDIPNPLKHQYFQMKFQNPVLYWKINQEDVIQLQLQQQVPVIQKSKIIENVIYGSLFDIETLSKHIQTIKGDFRGPWMKPRGVGRILEAQQLNETDFSLKVIMQGKGTGASYVTTLGDFQVIKIDDIEIAPYIQMLSARHQTNIIDNEAQPEDMNQVYQNDDELQESDDYSQTDIIECTDGPIEKDYEFKLAQTRDTLEEKLERPDDVEIHPRRELRSTLEGFAPMKSIRTSTFPFQSQSTLDIKQLYHIQQPGQLERQILKETRSLPGDDECYFSTIKQVIIRVNAQEIIDYSQNQRQVLSNFFQNDQQYQTLVNNLPIYQQINFTSLNFVNRTIIFTLQHEQKISLAHANITSFYTKEIIEMTQQFTIQVGFRRIFTLPTPYQQVSPFRGKLLRLYKTIPTTELSISFPSSLCAIHTQAPPVLIFKDNYVGSGKIRCFSAKFNIFERITLTGWPYRIHKRRCLIRYMFFNTLDVKYFQSASLTCGMLNGKIMAPMGEKGYFKAQFDGQLQNGQVIELKLYKQIVSCGLNFGLIAMNEASIHDILYFISQKWKESEKILMEGF